MKKHRKSRARKNRGCGLCHTGKRIGFDKAKYRSSNRRFLTSVRELITSVKELTY